MLEHAIDVTKAKLLENGKPSFEFTRAELLVAKGCAFYAFSRAGMLREGCTVVPRQATEGPNLGQTLARKHAPVGLTCFDDPDLHP